jgi:hypothetical protein
MLFRLYVKKSDNVRANARKMPRAIARTPAYAGTPVLKVFGHLSSES